MVVGAHFPNGVSTQAASASNTSAAAGDLDANNVYVAGNLTAVGSLTAAAGSVIGQQAVVVYSFASTSTAETAYLPVPFAGNITGAFVALGATATITTGFTVRVNSAGSVAVATVSNTSGSAGTQSSLTTTSTAVTTADSIQVSVAAAGTAGHKTIGVIVTRA